MWSFSEEVNRVVGREIVTPENEYDFLSMFRSELDYQADWNKLEIGDAGETIVNMWNVNIPVTFIVVDEQGDTFLDEITVDADLMDTYEASAIVA